MRRLVFFIVTSFMLTACAGTRDGSRPAPAPQTGPESTTTSSAKTRPYEVFGQHYYPVTDATGYRERGVASWYGGKFHGRKTANGERYDMYQYTAAHTTLPLPTWVKVTNLRNGSTVTVRVNDRGPFVKNRLIDLSYAAALQLGMVDDGTTLVEVEAIASTAAARPAMQAAIQAPVAPDPISNIPPTATVSADMTGAATDTGNSLDAYVDDIPATSRPPLPIGSQPLIYVQVGAFGDLGNAERMQTTLYNAGISEVRLDSGSLEGIPVHRVQIGPVDGVLDYDVLIAQLESIGISETHLVTR